MVTQVAEIQRLADEVQRLSGLTDRWNGIVNLLLFLTAVVGVLYFGASLRQSYFGKRLRTVQDALSKAKDEQLADEFAHRDERIARVKAEGQVEIAKVRADSDEKIAAANKRSDEISAKANRDAEDLRKQNLETESRLEAERNNRLDLEKSLSPRWLAYKVFNDGTTNADSIRKYAGFNFDIEFPMEAEARSAAGQLAFVLEKAGWKLRESSALMDLDASLLNTEGVEIRPCVPGQNPSSLTPEQIRQNLDSLRHCREVANALTEFLKYNGWSARTGSPDPDIPLNTIKITVKIKPNPLIAPQEVKELIEQQRRIEEKINKGFDQRKRPQR